MVTATIGKEHYRTELFIAGHTVIADEPQELGGTNLGPSPGQFLMLSLASCTAITLRMYADRKKWSVDKIKVEVASEKMDSKTLFRREVSFEGALDDDQRKRLLQIANACPVHKTLTNPIEVQTILV
jgi:putative redox protein